MVVIFKFEAKQCDAGDTFNCRQVATTYEKGGVVPQDLEKAALYFQKLCDARKDTECKDVQRIRKKQRQ